MCSNAPVVKDLVKKPRRVEIITTPAPAPAPVESREEAPRPAPQSAGDSQTSPARRGSRTASSTARKRRGKSSLRIELGGTGRGVGGSSGLNIPV